MGWDAAARQRSLTGESQTQKEMLGQEASRVRRLRNACSIDRGGGGGGACNDEWVERMCLQWIL